MKKLSGEFKRIIKGLAVVTVLFGFLSFYGFNCAPPSFQTANSYSMTMSSNGDLVPTEVSESTQNLAQALLTTEQVYQSLMNLTGQDEAGVETGQRDQQIAEFDRREGAFSVSPNMNLVNAPMLIALTSFAGETCDGLVAREVAQNAAARRFFGPVNFNSPIANVTDASYNQVVTSLATQVWGRAPSSEEMTFFTGYRTDYITGIPPAMIGQNGFTRSLMITTCTAILSAFDVFTY